MGASMWAPKPSGSGSQGSCGMPDILPSSDRTHVQQKEQEEPHSQANTAPLSQENLLKAKPKGKDFYFIRQRMNTAHSTASRSEVV